jgi:hypothetical protein
MPDQPRMAVSDGSLQASRPRFARFDRRVPLEQALRP